MLRQLTRDVDAWTANGIRYPLSALLYWPVLWAFWRAGQLSWRGVASCLVPAGLALAAQVLWALAPYYLPASAIGFFHRISLVWALLAALLLFPDERRLLSVPGFYAGMLLSVGGFVVLSISKGLFDAEVSWMGILIITVCSSFFGLYAVSVRWFLRGIHPLPAFGTVAQIVALGTLPPMFLFGNLSDLSGLSAGGWTLLATSSVLGIALGHVLMYTSVQRMGATIPSSVGTLAPFVTVSLAVAFLGESLTAMEWSAGLAMVVGALILLGTQDSAKKSG
jgi:drug/metabolite transporter (DMT)-like permease